MANYELLNSTCQLERLLDQMTQKMNRLAQLSSSIQEEEAYYATYPVSINLFSMQGVPHKWSTLLFIFVLVLSALTTFGLVCAIFLLLLRLLFKKLRFRSLGGVIKIYVGLFYFFAYLMALTSIVVGYGGFDDAGYLRALVPLPVALVAAYLAAFFVFARQTKQMNMQIEEENEAIEERNLHLRQQNQSLLAQCDGVNAEIKGLQQQIVEMVNRIHYPPDYVCLDAARYFIHGLRNDRADDYRRLIDLYEQENYRQRMLRSQQELVEMSRQQTYNQERMVKLMQFANCLNAASLATQIRTSADIHSLADTAHRSYYGRPLDESYL